MQGESLSGDNEDSWCAVLYWDQCSRFNADTCEPFNIDLSSILPFICAVLQSFSVIKYLNLGGQTLRYLLERDIV